MPSHNTLLLHSLLCHGYHMARMEADIACDQRPAIHFFVQWVMSVIVSGQASSCKCIIKYITFSLVSRAHELMLF